MEELKQTYFIDLRADSAGGNPVGGADSVVVRTDTNRTASKSLLSELCPQIQGRDILLGTHGFHVDRDHGIDYLSQWATWLDLGANGVFVGVLWPGDSRWLPFVDYPLEGNEAIFSGKILAGFLNRNFSGVASLSFASHSLGARVVLETISHLSGNFKLNSATIMAGAVDDTCLNSEYRNAATNVKKISVLASECDDVLKFAFPVGNPLSGIITRGDPYWHGALGRFGPNPSSEPPTLVATPILPDTWNFGHGSYINCVPLGSPPVQGKFTPLPLVVGPAGSNWPSCLSNWQQAWAAGFVSSRFQ